MPGCSLFARLPQALRFGVVGSLCFCVDAAVLTMLRPWLGLGVGRVASYLAAATVGWALNRAWTFRRVEPGAVVATDAGAARRQWALFLLSGLAGMTANGAVYALLLALAPICRAYPVLAVAAGAVAGAFVNFPLCRVVFR